ncbi:MAG: 2,4-dihydroxyhept-2-ene-1,7-dioic acid aldolase [Rhodobacteraceae bacterium]|nr:2,4-dihydroxyhept-2-ene-1,7-dioic acid aldolase [Paracoccaceae bacterium]MAY46626.1 2,4-dihydroxyhept-2-ene-1,7-dioic acid aldolase [Paracoccaceae bacterium]
MMLKEKGVFATPAAGRYLQQLCKHFAHKVEVRFDDTRGEAALPPGPAVMAATPERLEIVISAADAEGLELARGIIDSHLVRFAFREDFTGMDWQGEDHSNQ